MKMMAVAAAVHPAEVLQGAVAAAAVPAEVHPAVVAAVHQAGILHQVPAAAGATVLPEEVVLPQVDPKEDLPQ